MSAPLVIAHVLAPAPVGGLERVVRGLATGHGARGHAVHVLSIFDRGDAVTPVPLDGAPGVTQHILEIPRRRYDYERRQVLGLCAQVGAQVMHTHGYRPDVVDGAGARKARLPVVSTVHGFTGGGFKNRLFERLQVRSYRRFDAVVAVSKLLETQLAARGVPGERLHCIPNAWPGSPAAPLDRGAARVQLGIDRDARCIGWVGRLSLEKGPDVLVDAMAKLPGSAGQVAFIGTGPLADALRSRADALGLGRRVVWCGAVAEAARCYAAFDAFVISSRTEGTPIVLFEAMAAGVPLVVTRVGGIPDVVTTAEAALVPSENATALADALRDVLDRPAEAEARARRARARLDDAYALAPWLDRYEQLYRTVMGG